MQNTAYNMLRAIYFLLCTIYCIPYTIHYIVYYILERCDSRSTTTMTARRWPRREAGGLRPMQRPRGCHNMALGTDNHFILCKGSETPTWHQE